MHVKLIEPTIKPQNNLYITIANVRIHVGIVSTHTNTLQNNVSRNWNLLLDGVVVRTGTLTATLGSYDAFVDLNALEASRLYVFVIKNRTTEDKAVVSTIVGTPIVINEFHAFREPFEVFGGLEVVGTTSASAAVPGYVRLPSNTVLGDVYESMGYVRALSGVYVFRPSKILTHDSNMPSSVMYRAFPTLPVVIVEVYKLPVIRRLGAMRHSVEPATRLRVSVVYLDGSGERVFDTGVVVGVLELNESKAHVVSCVPVY
jgi:hypothetical protein